MAPGAPLVNEFCKSNIAYFSDFPVRGPETGFKEADYIKEENVQLPACGRGFHRTPRLSRGGRSNGRVLLQGSKQSPYITWRHMCRALDIPVSKMRTCDTLCGRGFLRQSMIRSTWILPTVRLAQITNRPVKIVLNYDEVLAAYRQRNAMNASLKMGSQEERADYSPRQNACWKADPLPASGHSTSTIFGALQNLPYKVPGHRVSRQAHLLQQGPVRHGEGTGDRSGTVLRGLHAGHCGRRPRCRPG